MILPLGGNNEESIFPIHKWELEDTISYCKNEYDIVPRPHWIIAEFGGKVSNQYYYYLLVSDAYFRTTIVIIIVFINGLFNFAYM